MTKHAEKQTVTMTHGELQLYVEQLQAQLNNMNQVNQSQGQTIEALKNGLNDGPNVIAPLPPKYRSILNDTPKISDVEELAAYRIMFDVQQEKLRCSRLRSQELEISLMSAQCSDTRVSDTDDSCQQLHLTFLRMQARISCVRKQLQKCLGEEEGYSMEGEGMTSLVLLKAIQELESLELVQILGSSIGSPPYIDAFPIPGDTTGDITMQ